MPSRHTGEYIRRAIQRHHWPAVHARGWIHRCTAQLSILLSDWTLVGQLCLERRTGRASRAALDGSQCGRCSHPQPVASVLSM
jgi:hypothetical protein